ncbi:MAG: alpha/beta fold hydrolase [Thermoleophilia bacterium]|nr:alpha/beta fold hydrolase [Thermoleophilia bacterium]
MIRGESQGEGLGIFLAHGLSAARKYVVHGSKVLPRAGYRLHTYDARGHGESDPAAAYDYEGLTTDLGLIVGDRGSPGPVILGGHSMGCHTAVAFALADPERVAALILAGPVYTGQETDPELDRWDERADALENGGPAEFARVIGERVTAAPGIKETIVRLAERRAALHRHPEAVAEALRQIPRSRPFGSLAELSALEVPVLVVGSHDEADDGHPYAVAEAYTEAFPQAEMISEEKGESPLSWQGGRLSREILQFLSGHGLAGR